MSKQALFIKFAVSLLLPSVCHAASPVANPDRVATSKNNSVTIDVLANDEGEVEFLSVDGVSEFGGTIVRNEDDTLHYTPPVEFTGLDRFEYRLQGRGRNQLAATVAVAVNEVIDLDGARRQLLSGVKKIAKPGVPGDIAVFGDQAFGLIHNGEYHSWIGGAVLGKGRVLIFGHGGFQDFSLAEDGFDTGRLYHNTLQWMGSPKSNGETTILTNVRDTQTWLQAQGYSRVNYRSNYESQLGQAKVAILNVGWHISDEVIQALFEFVASGGGLIFGEGGWVLESYGHYELPDAPENKLLRPAGLAFAKGTHATQDATKHCTRYTNALHALALVEGQRGLHATAAQEVEGITALDKVLDVLPRHDPIYQRIFDTVIDRALQVTPTPARPARDPLDKLALRWEADWVAHRPVAEITAHRTAEPVYGAIEPDAPHVTATRSFSVTQAGRDTRGKDSLIWLSTGLYAAPGEPVTVHLPQAVTGKGLILKINPEWNNVSDRPKYERMPLGNSREFALDETTTTVANAYGGLIYVVAPKQRTPGAFDITFEGVLEAPYFDLSLHTNADWLNTLRDKPAPWAELVSPNVIITVPSRDIRSLTQAEELMQFWHDGVAAQDELAGLGGVRTRPDRMVSMIQTAWGYGYAGYPIGGWRWNFTDYEDLEEGKCWGAYHELGHLHQSSYWTDSRTGEVTVNIFSMRAIEAVCDSGRASGGWGRQWDPVERTKMFKSARAKAGYADGSFAERLVLYSQLKEAFGWEAFQAVFQTYHDDPESALPKNTQQEWDQWMIRFSREVGLDLSPFFITWQFGVSNSAVASLQDLPPWNMLETGDDHYKVQADQSISLLNLLSNDFSLNGRVTLIGVNEPAHGALGRDIHGAYTYTPKRGFQGTDTFTYEVENGLRNRFSGTIVVTVGEP